MRYIYIDGIVRDVCAQRENNARYSTILQCIGAEAIPAKIRLNRSPACIVSYYICSYVLDTEALEIAIREIGISGGAARRGTAIPRGRGISIARSSQGKRRSVCSFLFFDSI